MHLRGGEHHRVGEGQRARGAGDAAAAGPDAVRWGPEGIREDGRQKLDKTRDNSELSFAVVKLTLL